MDAGKAKGSVELNDKADSVKVEILSPGGQILGPSIWVLKTPDAMPLNGMHPGYSGPGNPTFKITAASGGRAVTTTALARDTVVAIGSNGIELKGRDPVRYGDIQSILQAAPPSARLLNR